MQIFFDKSVLDKKSFHYLLPPPRIVHNHRLRHQTKFQPPKTRTARFNKSFVVHALRIVIDFNYFYFFNFYLFFFVFVILLYFIVLYFIFTYILLYLYKL